MPAYSWRLFGSLRQVGQFANFKKSRAESLENIVVLLGCCLVRSYQCGANCLESPPHIVSRIAIRGDGTWWCSSIVSD